MCLQLSWIIAAQVCSNYSGSSKPKGGQSKAFKLHQPPFVYACPYAVSEQLPKIGSVLKGKKPTKAKHILFQIVSSKHPTPKSCLKIKKHYKKKFL